LPLNLPTLLFVTTLVVAFSGGLLIFAQQPRWDMGATALWGAAILLGALGFGLTGLGQGTGWIGDGLGTAAFLGAMGLSWAAARVFAKRRAHPWLAAAGAGLWLATAPVHSGSPRWLALSCAVGAAYILATAAELWRLRGERLPSRPAAVALLLVHASVYAARGAFALVHGEAGPWADTISAGMMLESLLNTVGIAFILLAMMKERVELRTAEQLRALALQDSLTGIGNRRSFDEQLEQEVRRARRMQAPMALLMIDVDRFKAFNDEFGHLQGDTCLRAVAGAIAGLVRRPGDLATRYGGEEFAVLLPGTDLAGAAILAEAMRAAVMTLALHHLAEYGVVTISIGVAALRAGGEEDTGAALVRVADQALYEAKRGGRNRVHAAGLVAVAA